MPKILIVENNKEAMAEYESFLSEEGHKIIKAYDGQEGVNKFHNDKFDLVIADLNLPKITGKKFVDQLQGPTSRMNCPLIVCSENLDPQLEKYLESDSKIHVLHKPIDKPTVLGKIQELIQRPSDSSGKMDVRFINPVLQSTMNVLKELTGFQISVGRPYLKTNSEPSGDISGIVGVMSTGFKGTISLSFAEAGYLKIISTMLGENCTEINDENKDAVAEILNMVFGQAKKTLNEAGMDIKPAIPTVIRGAKHCIQHHENNPTIVIPFSSPEIGSFRSEVSSSVG